MNFSYEQLKKITNATGVNKTDKTLYSICTDTRQLLPGQVYLPLSGENFDGEKFIDAAIEKGAAGYFTSKNFISENKAIFSLQVNDTKIAYLKLASAYKNIISPKTIAITGSSGKTTTKEILNSIFSANRRTHKSKLNHNNEIGLCQTLLSMPENTEILIIEMGMRGLGEIELLSKYAQPDYAIITNIGTTHIGRLGSRQNIAKAKCEIVSHLKPSGLLITFPDELYTSTLANFTGTHIIIDKSKHFKMISMSKEQTIFEYKSSTYSINEGGEYLVDDTLLAIETALLYGLTPNEIQLGLKAYHTIEKRFEKNIVNGLNIINDSYNANPESMKAAIKTFLELYDGNKILVLADMKELGAEEKEYHAQIGNYLNNFKQVNLVTIGNLAKSISDNTSHPSKHFTTNKEAAAWLKKAEKGTTLLLKGSRSMKLEEIIEEIKK